MKTELGAGFLLLVLALVQAQDNNSINISGRVVDDATGLPIVDFVVQRGSTNFTGSGEMSWDHYMMGDARTQNPDHWTVNLENYHQAARILAPGHVPQVLRRDAFTNGQTSGLEIRMKPGATLRGVVLDDDGRPAAGAKVLIATVQRVYLKDGKFEYGEFRGGSTNTDDAGHFTLRGESDASQRVVIVSADGHLVWPAIQSGPGQDMKITLPKPGNLVVRYDIPGDAPEAKPEIYLITTNKDRALWKDIGFGLSFTVTNGGVTVLTNLTPGLYNFRRWKNEGAHGAESEQQTVVVEAGHTRHADMIRTNGQRICGKVLGLDEAKASGGYIYVKSGDATGLPWPQRSRNEQNEFNFRTFDVSQFGADGTFQTAMLNPGTYTVAADVYPPGDVNSGMNMRNSNPDYVAVAKVTVTADTLPPVTLKLAQAQYVDIAGTAVDDETGMWIEDLMIESGKVKPDKPDEIIWSEGYQGAYDGGRILMWAQKEGAALRFRANGYVPQVFTRKQIIASRQTANLQVRLKRGGELHGLVLDHAGLPATHATVYLAPLDLGYVRFGEVGSMSSSGSTTTARFGGGGSSGSGGSTITYWAHTFATTDAAGRFTLRGVDGKQTRVIVVTADEQMVQPVQVSGPGQDLKITLPEPATLIVHYDIPGDVAEAGIGLALHTNELTMPLWKYITSNPWAKVSNGGETVLTNLLPGTYDFARSKVGGAVGHEYAFIFGDPFKWVQFDTQKIILKPGQTQHVNMVRSIGRRVQGQVTGMESITNQAGAFLYVGSATAIGNPLDFKTNNLEPCYDAVMLDTNGMFQTALLEPGNYTLVAEVYVWGKPPKPEPIPADEPQYGGVMFNPQQLSCVGSAKVTVTATAAPPVKIQLRPWVEPPKSP